MASADTNSDGSDIEVDRNDEFDFFADINGENELLEEHDQALPDELADFARQIFANESDKEDFAGFQVITEDRQRFERQKKRNYTKTRGVSANLPHDAKKVDFFMLFWDNEMWERLVLESNRYAEQQRTAHPPARSYSTFKAFSVEEMKTFIGLCLMMGILRLPKRSDYWRVLENCWLAHTKFGKAMSRNRFNCIWRYLHLQNNTEPNPSGDKLFKLRKFLDSLLKKYQEVLVPGKMNYFIFYVL